LALIDVRPGVHRSPKFRGGEVLNASRRFSVDKRKRSQTSYGCEQDLYELQRRRAVAAFFYATVYGAGGLIRGQRMGCPEEAELAVFQVLNEICRKYRFFRDQVAERSHISAFVVFGQGSPPYSGGLGTALRPSELDCMVFLCGWQAQIKKPNLRQDSLSIGLLSSAFAR
jgi:hypothetical protein